MRNAIRQCADVNTFFRRMGEEAWGNRCDASLVMILFHEAMVRENATIPQDDNHGVFLYLSFSVRKCLILKNSFWAVKVNQSLIYPFFE